jgi:ATP-dependent RNA helicase SUPV3L1/SUV3
MELLGTFLDFVDEYFIKKQTQLTKPKPSGSFLSDLEKYYQKLGLYYSFSKNFDIDFDPEWVYKERERTSGSINKILIKL